IDGRRTFHALGLTEAAQRWHNAFPFRRRVGLVRLRLHLRGARMRTQFGPAQQDAEDSGKEKPGITSGGRITMSKLVTLRGTAQAVDREALTASTRLGAMH